MANLEPKKKRGRPRKMVDEPENLADEKICSRKPRAPKEDAERLDKFIRQARELYLYTSKPQREIAEIVGISEATLTVWKKKFDWEAQRQGVMDVPNQMQRIYCNMISRIDSMTADPDGKWDFNEIQKAINALDKFGGRQAMASHIEKVGLLWAKFLVQKRAEDRNHYIEIYRDFATWYIEEEAKKAGL